MLLAVPNFSEGRDRRRIQAISGAFATGAGLLDAHSDPVHNRSVLTLDAGPGHLAGALARGAAACVERIDMRHHHGEHPCVGALDVCPVVWLREEDRDEARREALDAAGRIADELAVPVFLYGELATTAQRRERAFFREGGLRELRRRMAAGELEADLGPSRPHRTAGATLVTARPPLAAFNLELDAGIEVARSIASVVRESGGGLPSVRAIGVDLGHGRSQVSTNVQDPVAVPLAEVVELVRELARLYGARLTGAEIVGLVPEAALDGFPSDLALPAYQAKRHVIEGRVSPPRPGVP